MAAQSTLKSYTSSTGAYRYSTFVTMPRSRKSSLTNSGDYSTAVCTRSCIAGLPNELIISIFQYACDDMKHRLTALSISLVSHAWRSIAHALPELWTHTTISVNHPRRFEAVEWYLRLSRDTPLDVKMLLLSEGECNFEMAMGLLVQNATRWKRADIQCGERDLCIFKRIKKLGVPMLESLRFDVAGSVSQVQSCKAFRNAPMLRKYAPSGLAPSECVVAWAQLKTVVIRDFFDVELYDWLCDAKAMEELVIDEECFFEKSYTDGLWLRLPASRLTMRSVPRLVDSTLMETVVLASLTAVDISVADGSTVDWRFTPRFVGMLKRSGFSLRELTLCNVPLDDAAVMDILACAPQLLSLTIHEPAKRHCITNAFLSAVSLPELRRLELVWSFDACEERVLDMIERMKTLECVVLGRRFGVELSERTVERMNLLRKGGVKVSQW